MISYILTSQVDLCSISKQFNFSSYHYVQLHVNTRCCWRLQRIFDSNWLKIEWICNNFHSIIQSNTDDTVNFSMQSGSLLISGCAIENLDSFTIHCWYVPVFRSDCIFQSNEEKKPQVISLGFFSNLYCYRYAHNRTECMMKSKWISLECLHSMRKKNLDGIQALVEHFRSASAFNG